MKALLLGLALMLAAVGLAQAEECVVVVEPQPTMAEIRGFK